MNSELCCFAGIGRHKNKLRRQSWTTKLRQQAEDGFLCSHCHAYVSSISFVSGVHNRNHCPYCLWSRHLDLHTAGDRLSACKASMQPLGLTMKVGHKKYRSSTGELMVVHICKDCMHISINRIAADDDPERLFQIFQISHDLGLAEKERLMLDGINILEAAETRLVRWQLFGG